MKWSDIREINRVLVELASRGAADSADVQDALRRITETAARTMPVARATYQARCGFMRPPRRGPGWCGPCRRRRR